MSKNQITVTIADPVPSVPSAIEQGVVEVWQQAAKVLQDVLFVVEDPFGDQMDSYSLTMDLSQIIQLLQEAQQHEGGFVKFREALRESKDARAATLTIELTPESAPDSAMTFYHAAAVALQQLYLTLNIAQPGSCQILGSQYEGEQAVNIDPPVLHAMPFIDAYLNSVDTEWPTLKRGKVQQIWSWLEKLETSQTETAILPINKVLFGLLELGQSSHGLTNADSPAVYRLLELLTQCGHGENHQIMRSRVGLILGEPTDEGNFAQELYVLKDNHESGARPYRRQPLSVHDYNEEILSQLRVHNSPVEEGLAVVLAIVQKLSVELGSGYTFVETASVKTIGNE